MIPLTWPWLQEDFPPSFLVECTFTCLKNTWQKETFIAILFTIVWISNYYQQQSTNKNKKQNQKFTPTQQIHPKNTKKSRWIHASIHLLFSTKKLCPKSPSAPRDQLLARSGGKISERFRPCGGFFLDPNFPRRFGPEFFPSNKNISQVEKSQGIGV